MCSHLCFKISTTMYCAAIILLCFTYVGAINGSAPTGLERADSHLNNSPENAIKVISNTTNTELVEDNTTPSEKLNEKVKQNSTAKKIISGVSDEAFNMLNEGDFANKIKVLPQEKDLRESLNVSDVGMKSKDAEWIEDDAGEDLNIVVQNNLEIIENQEIEKGVPFNFIIIGASAAVLMLLFSVFFFVHRRRKFLALQIDHKILIDEDDFTHFSI